MPARRNVYVVSSPEEDDQDDDVVSSNHHTPSRHSGGATLHSGGTTTTTTSITNKINLQNMSLNSSNTTTSIPPQRPALSPIPLDISSSDDDGEFAEPNRNGPDYVLEQESPVFGGSVNLVLRNMGLNLKRQWFESCMSGLEGAVNGFSGLDDSRKAKLCFEQFLKADMNCCGSGVLPQNVHSLHSVEIKGPFILQVDEIVNISCPLQSRYQKAAPGLKRCLKLSMTDGVQRVFGMEYRPIGALDVFSPAGMKVAISNVFVRRGILMLVPEAFGVLGGVLEELESARERLVQEVNKPARGKRTRSGGVLTLATRATLAAWPQGNVNDPVQTNISRVDRSSNSQTAEQGIASGAPESVRAREHTAPPNHQEARSTSFSASALNGDVLHTPASRVLASDRAREHAALRSHQEAGTTSYSSSTLNGSVLHTPASGAPARDRASGHTTLRSHQEAGTTSFCASALDGAELHTQTHRVTENIYPSSRRHSLDTSYSAEAMDVEETNMANEIELPYILSGKKEIPFTYLASLSAKWALMKRKVRHVQGMIKCVLIGVKRFQYKGTDKYELRLHIDDGSLISEILIDHHLVERLIGHPPEVVAAGLDSPDANIVSIMRKKLIQFQTFLANFEGMMVVQLNESCPFPLVMEMKEGCTVSDAWKLLGRLKPPPSTPQPHHSEFDPIELSP